MEFEEFLLAASTTDLTETVAARRHADLLEYRLDLTADGVDALDGEFELPVLVTNRVEHEGGNAQSGTARLDTLARAIEKPAVEAVDIELATLRSGRGQHVVDRAREHGIAVVVSTHDFTETPDRERLRDLLDAASERGDVAKLAVTATDVTDVLDLLTVTAEATRDGQAVATMAMGEVGRHSRVVTPLYGSRIGYAPLDRERATAPGQYDLETFRTLYETLREK